MSFLRTTIFILAFSVLSNGQTSGGPNLDESVNSALRLSKMALYDARLEHAENLIDESRFAAVGELTKAHKLRLAVYRYRILRFRSILYLSKADPQKKLSDLVKFSETAETLGDERQKAEYYMMLSSAYRENEDSENADKYEEQARDVFKKIGEFGRVADIRASRISRLHTSLFRAGKKTEIVALIPDYEKEVAFSSLFSRYTESFNTRHLAQIHLRQTGNHMEALRLFKRSLELREEIGFRPFIPASYSSLGDVYTKLGEPENAIKAYQESVRLAEKINFIRYAVGPLIRIGDIYVAQGEYEKARESYRLANKAANEHSYEAGTVESAKKMAELRARI